MENNIDNTAKIIDLTYLTSLSKGNKLFIKEMIVLFLTENPGEIECLEKGIIDRNFDLIKTAAHKLRSSIPFVGLDKIIEMEVSQVETLASNKSDIETIEKLFVKIKSNCKKARLELTAI